MKPSCLLFAVSVGVAALQGADATTPIDYTQRNGPFAPAASVEAEKQKPAANQTVQDKRVPTQVVDKTLSPVRDQRAPIDVEEAREKEVKDKDLAAPGTQLDGVRRHRDEAAPKPATEFNHRQADISTGADTKKPPTVARYQDSLSAASTRNMAQYPAMDQAATAKINRFVFRKNPPDTAAAAERAPITPAAGGSPATSNARTILQK